MVLAQNEMDKLITKVQSILSRSLLVAGTGITITLNADGTVTISTSSTGSSFPVTGTNYELDEGASGLEISAIGTNLSPDLKLNPNGTATGSSLTLEGTSTPSEISAIIAQNDSSLSVVSVAAVDADCTPIQLEVAGNSIDQLWEFTKLGETKLPDGGIIDLGDTTGTKIGTATNKLGFYGKAPVALQTGVAVDAAAIHAALVNLGLITA